MREPQANRLITGRFARRYLGIDNRPLGRVVREPRPSLGLAADINRVLTAHYAAHGALDGVTLTLRRRGESVPQALRFD
jgi:hypothetical protein